MINNSFKQSVGKIIIHLVIWIITFILIDFCCSLYYLSAWFVSKKFYIPYYISYYVNTFKINEKAYIKRTLSEPYRGGKNIFSPKRSLLLLGCSYTYGLNLNDNETFSHRLAELTGRPVYNRAFPSHGLQQALIQLKYGYIYNLALDPEYVFYLYINDHINRFDHLYIPLDMYSKIKDGSLVFTKIPLLKRTYIYMFIIRYLHDINPDLYTCNSTKKYKDLLLLHFKEMRSEVEKLWGEDTKFIILTYDPIPDCQKGIFEELETDGFTIIKLNELLDAENPNKINSLEYRISGTDPHPNARLWEELTPKLVEKINLY